MAVLVGGGGAVWLVLGRAGQTRTFLCLRIPDTKAFDDSKREDVRWLKTTQSQKTQQVTDRKFCVTGIIDIRFNCKASEEYSRKKKKSVT